MSRLIVTRERLHLCINCLLYSVVMFSVLSVMSCTRSPEIAQRYPVRTEVVSRDEPVPELNQFERWERLVRENRNSSVEQKLRDVNSFFNDFDSVEDRLLWGREDYWATLFETLEVSGGDCEDFTIAKYFTLRELNIPEESMRITYVISLDTKKPHMVLTLQTDSSQEPIVLDSTNNYLFPVSRRQDLVPVYSFNADGYWLANKGEGWKGERIGSAAKLSLWRSVLKRTEKYVGEISDG